MLGLENPLDLRGPQFLALYVSLLASALLAGLALRWLLRPRGDEAAARPWASRASPDEIAYLARGLPGLLESAVASLLAYGRAVVDWELDGFTRAGQKTAFAGGPAEEAVFRALPGPGDAARAPALREALRPVIEPLDRRLERAGLTPDARTATRVGVASVLPLLALAILGLAKIEVGIFRGRPVGFLVLLVVATVMVAVAIAVRPPRVTRTGESLLRYLRTKHGPLLLACGRPERLDPEQVALAVAVFGGAATAGLATMSSAFAGMKTFLARPEATGSGSGDWSSSSCGSSGCGGGCGGGGCGGCGG